MGASLFSCFRRSNGCMQNAYATLEDDQSPFESLPQALMWRIIAYAPGQIANLRKTSSTLRGCVDEYSLREPHPDVMQLKLVTKLGETNSSVLVTIFMPDPSRESKMFLWRLVAKCPRELKNIRIIKGINCTGHQLRFICKQNDEVISKYLVERIGRNIGKVVIEDGISIKPPLKMLGEFQYAHLGIAIGTLTDETVYLLLETVGARNIDSLQLHVWKDAATDAVDFILRLSSHVRSLKLQQNNNFGATEHWGDGKALFGVEDSCWMHHIPDMLSRKLEKLSLTNCWILQTRPMVDELCQKLLNLEKKVWFSASCVGLRNESSYNYNGYEVEISHTRNPRHPEFYGLSVKPETREN